MDIKKKLHHLSNGNNQHTGVNDVSESKSKSVKTQTEESSLYSIFSSCDRKKINLSNEDIKQCYNQSMWKTDCVSLCPVCSRTLIPPPYTQNTNQLYQFPVPWCSPCAPYNNYMPMGIPPFISIPVIPNVLPCNMMNQNYHDLEVKMSGTSLNSKVHNLSQQTSNISFSNGGESSNNSSFTPTKGDKSKLKTCIRSEPDVTKKDIELESIRLLNSTFNNNPKRNRYKSDPSIPSSTKVKMSCNNSSNKQNHDSGVKSNYLLNKNNDLKCDKGDSNSIFNATNKEFFKSPIYKYADIRIHELSSSLKDIKDNIHKLSSKASELHISDSSISSDDNLKKYFKSIYTEVRDKDVPSLSNELAAKFAKMKAATASSSCNNNDSNSVVDEASLCSSRRDVFDDMYSNYQDKSGSERDKMSDAFDETNSMKRTVPLHDISNVLNQNFDEDCSLQNIPVKIKSDMLSNNKARTKIRNNNKISAHSSSPTFMSNLNNSKSNDEKTIAQNGKVKSGFSKPFVNISFNSNYDSGSDEENSIMSCSPRTNESNEKINESFVLNEKNDHNISKYLNVRSNEFNNYDDMIGGIDDDDCNDNDNRNNNNNDSNNKNNNEVTFPIRSQKTQKQQQQQQQQQQPPQQSTKHIENWLGKTVVEINSQQHSQQQYQQQQHSSGKRQSQYATLNNLEVLSKISEEEEEEKFSSSSIADSDEMDKPFDISKYCISNNNANNNNDNNSSNISTSIRKMSIPNNYFINEKCFQDVSKLKTRVNNELEKSLDLEEKCGETWIH